jgi:hypothetical protein
MVFDPAKFRDLIVSSTSSVTGRGLAVFFSRNDLPLLQPGKYQIEVTPPDRVSFKAIASAEYARIAPPGEVNALLFANTDRNQIPVGSKVTVLGLISASAPDV